MNALTQTLFRHAAPALPSIKERRMNVACPAGQQAAAVHELCFAPLSKAGSTKVFPCDSNGKVELDALSPLQRIDYLFVRMLIGRDFTGPLLVRASRSGSTDLGRSGA